jgi:hypothetical protein
MASDDQQQRILRFPRAEDDKKKGEPDFVLLQVLPSGIHALDLKLVGTNGFDAYVVKCENFYYWNQAFVANLRCQF